MGMMTQYGRIKFSRRLAMAVRCLYDHGAARSAWYHHQAVVQSAAERGKTRAAELEQRAADGRERANKALGERLEREIADAARESVERQRPDTAFGFPDADPKPRPGFIPDSKVIGAFVPSGFVADTGAISTEQAGAISTEQASAFRERLERERGVVEPAGETPRGPRRALR